MTKEKKQELRKLLHEAKERLKIRDEYGVPLCLPEGSLPRVLTRILAILWFRLFFPVLD